MQKQAGYMAAPERFADRSDSSCTAGAVHTWPLTTDRIFLADGRFAREADMAGPAADSTRSLVTLSVVWLLSIDALQKLHSTVADSQCLRDDVVTSEAISVRQHGCRGMVAEPRPRKI
jgi:hypothetical protein